MARYSKLSLLSASLLSATLLAGCGANPSMGSSAITPSSSTTPGIMSGKLYGGPNPIVASSVELYTSGLSYGGGATVVASTTTGSDGGFGFTLPSTSAVCTAGQYLYVTSAGGTTGSNSANPASLLMVPIGECSANYTTTSAVVAGNTVYTNTYTGSNLWIDELTTAVSAYALSGFMTVTGMTVDIGAPANNTATYSASLATPSAGGLAHAFANALNIMNISTGQPYAFFGNRTSGGVIPDAEIFTIGNILQACVNSNGTTGTNTATGNDGTPCGKLFSLSTPPVSGAVTPTNTMAAMLNLAHYPNPTSTWNTGCTATSTATGNVTASSCIYGLAAASGAYVGGLTSAAGPTDWALAITYQTGWGVQTGTTCAGTTCSGINYPFYIALDYKDNAYVLNFDAATPTTVNLLGFGPDASPIFASANESSNSMTYAGNIVKQISTDTAGHVVGTNAATTSSANNVLRVYNTADGSSALTTNPSTGTSTPLTNAVDPYNNVYFISSGINGSLRRFKYDGTTTPPTYTLATYTPAVSSAGGSLQLVLDANLNAYVEESSASGAFNVDYALNTGTLAAPAFPSAAARANISASTNSSAAFGITVDASGNAYAGASTGLFKITPTVTTGTPNTATIAATGPITVPSAYTTSGVDYFHYLYTDGAGNIIGTDNANGSGFSGFSVYDLADGGIALGTYRGCFAASKACGTSASAAPISSPRSAAIDSAGDVWMVAGASHTMAVFIGGAAPTWPGLSMLKSGKPQ